VTFARRVRPDAGRSVPQRSGRDSAAAGLRDNVPAAPPREASKAAAVALVALFVVVLVLAVVAYGAPLELRGREHRDTAHDREVGYGLVRFDGAGPERWAARYRHARRELVELRRRLRRERRVLLSDPHVVEAINLAAATYGFGATLWRKAACETGGTYNPHAYNSSSGAAGLFQFLGSTWRSTPYGRFDVDSPYANALAAGWMHAHGRGGEWACR
jgi:hypothetical protein